jgi:hypothetical protein
MHRSVAALFDGVSVRLQVQPGLLLQAKTKRGSGWGAEETAVWNETARRDEPAV